MRPENPSVWWAIPQMAISGHFWFYWKCRPQCWGHNATKSISNSAISFRGSRSLLSGVQVVNLRDCWQTWVWEVGKPGCREVGNTKPNSTVLVKWCHLTCMTQLGLAAWYYLTAAPYEIQCTVRASEYDLRDPDSNLEFTVEVDWMILNQSHIFSLTYHIGLLRGGGGTAV